MNLENRVLFLTSTARDAANCGTVLADAGIESLDCGDVESMRQEIARGCAAIVVPCEVLAAKGSHCLRDVLNGQPAWSDLPVLVMTRNGSRAGPERYLAEDLGNVVFLERPMHVPTLVSAVRAAFRARQRQYEIRRLLMEQARTTEILREADHRKDEFLAMLAHELRNPLAPIHNGLEILKIAATDSGTDQDVCAMTERQVRHLARLVDDLLDVSRITRGRVELRKQATDLVDVIARAAETVAPLVEARQHRLTISQPGRPVWAMVDATRMTQVVGNLLTNAAKYTETGGQIAVSLEKNDDSATIRVLDTGLAFRRKCSPASSICSHRSSTRLTGRREGSASG